MLPSITLDIVGAQSKFLHENHPVDGIDEESKVQLERPRSQGWPQHRRDPFATLRGRSLFGLGFNERQGFQPQIPRVGAVVERSGADSGGRERQGTVGKERSAFGLQSHLQRSAKTTEGVHLYRVPVPSYGEVVQRIFPAYS